MISLSQPKITVSTPDGGSFSFDEARLQEDLAQVCENVPDLDGKILHDLVRVVRNFVRRKVKDQQKATPEELNALVCRLLHAAGLAEAAQAYQARYPRPYGLAAMSIEVTMQTAEPLLAADPFFRNQPVTMPAAAAVAALQRLGLSRATPKTLVELAKSFCLRDRYGTAESKAEARAASPEFLKKMTASVIPDWLQSAVEWLSVSALVPLIEVRLHLLQFDFPDSALVELSFFPLFNEACAALNRALNQVRQEVEDRVEKTALQPVYAEVRLLGMGPLVHDRLQFLPMRARAFRLELHAVWQYYFSADDKVRLVFD